MERKRVTGSTPTQKKIKKEGNFDGNFYDKDGKLIGRQLSLFGELGEKREWFEKVGCVEECERCVK